MITYWLCSMLLSLVGWGLYRLLRPHLDLRGRRLAIHLLIVGSLGLPALLPRPAAPAPPPPLAWGQPVDPALLQQHCRCEQPNYAHRIHYRSSALYHQLLGHRQVFTSLMAILLGGGLLHTLLQLSYLGWLGRRCRRRTIDWEGRPLTLLYPPRPRGIGAFTWGRRYVLWHEAADQWPPALQQAVLAHEGSHLRQHNTLEKFALRLLRCWWPLNPVAYALSHELDQLSERLADEAAWPVLGSRKAYARLLLALEQGQVPSLSQAWRRPPTLRYRVEQLLQAPPLTRRSIWPVVALLAGQLLLLLPAQAATEEAWRTASGYLAAAAQVKTQPQNEAVIFCPDCESVCSPVDQFNPSLQRH